uniref:Uncharacterized protein n=1 Tax=Oryza brachyantha TaxID=4533 RepID=J3LW30_ORYBR
MARVRLQPDGLQQEDLSPSPSPDYSPSTPPHSPTPVNPPEFLLRGTIAACRGAPPFYMAAGGSNSSVLAPPSPPPRIGRIIKTGHVPAKMSDGGKDFKTVDEYNHAVHKKCSKLRFCEKEPSEADKIEKTLSTMLPSKRIITQQYREKDFIVYSSLIQTLKQAKRNHELTVWNSNQRPLGTAPLPEVHANAKTNVPKGNNQTRKSSGNGKNKRSKKQHGTDKKGKSISKQKNDNSNKTTCFRYGCYNHIAKKCRTPKHLVELYIKSMGRSDNNKKYEANFASQMLENGAMDPIPHGAGPSMSRPEIPHTNF